MHGDHRMMMNGMEMPAGHDMSRDANAHAGHDMSASGQSAQPPR